MSEEFTEDNDPALKKFSRPMEMLKHTAKTALKWAVTGAIIGAIAFGLGPMLIGGGVGAVATGIASLFGGSAASAVGGWFAGGITGALASGAILGAQIGGVAGLLKGAVGASEAADEAAEAQVDYFQRREVRQERLAALEQQRALHDLNMAKQAQMMGLSPNVGFGRNNDERSLG